MFTGACWILVGFWLVVGGGCWILVGFGFDSVAFI